MTKAHRVRAMGSVIAACNQFKDKKPLAEAVRKIVDDLRAEEVAFKEQARAENAANVEAKKGRQPEQLSGDDQELREVVRQIKGLPAAERGLILRIVRSALSVGGSAPWLK